MLPGHYLVHGHDIGSYVNLAMEKITPCSVFLGNLELLIMGLLQPKAVLYIYFANISS